MASEQGLRLGAIQLAVASLERSIAYYTTAIGLRQLAERAVQPIEPADRERGARTAALGSAGRVLLELVERSDAPLPARGSTGLYHFALLAPDRRSLAAWLAHAIADQVTLYGAADHYVSEALYLYDPDGHGIEIYADRPRELWQGAIAERMTTMQLDVSDLLGELSGTAAQVPGAYSGLPEGTRMGHFHFKVRDVPETLGFYEQALGLDCTAQLGRHAVFLSDLGYHHHIGANTWESAGGPAPQPASISLIAARLMLADEQRLQAALERARAASVPVLQRPDLGPEAVLLSDPAGNRLLLSLDSAGD